MSHLYSKSYLIRSPDFQGCVRSVIFERLMPILEDAAGKHEGLDVYEIGSAVGAEIMSAYAFGTGKSFDIVRTAKEEERKQYLERGKKKLRKLKGAKEARRALEQQCLVKCKDAYEDFQQNLDIGADAKEHANGRNDGSSTYPVTFSQLVQQIPLKENIRDSNEVLRRIASEVLDNIEAAREGIGIGLTYMTHELSQHMDVQDSLRQELKTLEPHCIFTSSQDLPSLTEMLRNLDGLPLLDAVVTETLRLHPPALGATPRDVPEQGVLVEGYFIPSGTIIHSSPYCLHRQSEVFPDAESWKPERWMRPKNRTSIDNNTPENDSDGKVKATQKDVETHRGDADIKQWLFHFSKGPKMCVGNNFALIGEFHASKAIFSCAP